MRCIREYHILSSELLDPSGHQWKTRLDNLRGQLFAGKKDGGGAKNEEESASMGRFWMPGGAHAWLVFVAFGAYGQTTFGLSALYVLTSTTVDELSQGRGRAATRAAAKEGASKPSDVALILEYMRAADKKKSKMDQHNQEMAAMSRRMDDLKRQMDVSIVMLPFVDAASKSEYITKQCKNPSKPVLRDTPFCLRLDRRK